MKNRIVSISLAVMLALSVGLIGCGSQEVPDITQYNLTISSTEGGSVTTPGEGTGGFTYGVGEIVDLVAEVEEGYHFVGWTGDVGTIADVSDATTTITMNADYSIVADFESKPWDYTIELSFHATIAEMASIVQYVYAPWIAEVEALTGSQGGRFDIIDTYGDVPFDSTTSLSAISSGVVDIGQLYPDTFKLGALSYMPFMFPSMESTAYVMYMILTEANGKWDHLKELDEVKILLVAPLGGAQWWGNVEVGMPADMSGVKVRVDGAYADDILAVGATPVDLGISDLGTALQTRIVDGCFFTYSGIGAWSGIGPNTRYTTEVDMFYRAYSLAMNKAAYDSLPAEAREALDSVCGAAKSVELAAAHSAGMAEVRAETESDAQYGRPIYVPSPAELQLWKDATANVKNDWVVCMTDWVGLDGAGILARAQELIAEYEASAS